ncbi:MAG: septation protein A [Gammaproteobacteria bacterium SG8_11]|nr:MAG: septation protein A [Gammaproteobacteria bacterium SG8_11]
MKFFIDFLPLLLFFTAYKLYDIYVATAVAIVASFVQTGYFWAKHRRFETTHLITLGLLVVFGGATLILHNEEFIKWKFSIVNWLLGLVFLFTQLFGNKPLLQRMLESQVSLPDFAWRRMNMSWIVYFMLLGFANLYVMHHFDTDTWVDFKFFGNLAMTSLLVIGQGIYMYRHLKQTPVRAHNNGD